MGAGLAAYFVVGILFGFVLTKGEVISWFRIQEMFRFHSFHMYGIIASAIATTGVSLALLRRLNARALGGMPIGLAPKTLARGWRYPLGGTIFGLGWALTGACPGPLFALLGAGITVMAAAIASAIAGTWAYGYLRPKLPH